MIDIYNRKIDYIRISVTDRCNLRCVYCMPEEGITWANYTEILSYEEIIFLCKVFSKIGISKIKITGGEPLVRKDLSYLIKEIKNINGIDNVTLTTNGILLDEQIESLVEAGVDAINISLDTLDENKYKKLTRVGQLKKVMSGINKALKYDKLNIKINCVPLEAENYEDILNVIKLAENNNISVRFIELMPIGLGKDMKGISEDKIKEIIEEKLGRITPYDKPLGNGPSGYYTIDNFKGKIGFISAVTHKFCDSCNRVRLTSQGFLKTCLQYNKGTDLRALVRNRINEEDLIQIIQNTIYNKPLKNNFFEENLSEDLEKHTMSQIGG
jgi:cyclic pyranopterin phosphate synthase